MCLGIPGKIVETFERDELPMARVEFGGILKDICLAYTPDAEPGQPHSLPAGTVIEG